MPLHDESHGQRNAVAYVLDDGNGPANGHGDGHGAADSDRVRVQLWVGFGCGPICGHSPSCRDRRVAARRAADQRVA